ncbi:hypothetical protein ABKN59_010850 [Abortiporus biennis]
MFPFVLTLALAFISFIASAFVILRIVIPILPPNPLSRRVPPSEFGLPNFKSLSPADKSHIWLALCDIIALGFLVWQAVSEYFGGVSGFAIASDPLSAVRVWLALTLRQSCLLIVASLTLLHVRLGRPVSFGNYHWMLWSPTVLLLITSTTLAGVLAGTNVPTFFYGLLGFSTSVAVISTIAFGCLIGTLVIIKRNLAALNDIRDPWPPAHDLTEKPRPSFGTEDVEALKDGSSWITSRASSRRDSISAFSFSTHHSHSQVPSNASVNMIQHPSAMASNPSIPPKSSFWFNPATPYNGRATSPVPPVPPLPSPYRSHGTGSGTLGGELTTDPDPFRRDPRPRMGSQSSWLTESSSERTTISAWSFPTTRAEQSPAFPSTPNLQTTLLPSTSRPTTPAMMGSAEVLGGYGYAPEVALQDKGLNGVTGVPAGDLDVSVYRTAGWLVSIWVPLALALPYLSTVASSHVASSITSILLVVSVSISSPLLALNIIFRSPMPIPSGLFDSYSEPPSVVMRAPSPASTLPSVYRYKRSDSVTVVEGRRSGDVWVANGDAVEGKTKFGRAMTLLQPKPKLSVLPPQEDPEEAQLTPPLPIQTNDNMPSVPQTPQSQISAEMGVIRNTSKSSSYYSGHDESLNFATQIMIAQRHYSAVATTMVLPPSPERRASMEDNEGATTGVATKRQSGHLRVRSISSTTGGVPYMAPISPPPSSPLPPTPPSIKNMRTNKLSHRKSHSSSGFSFGAIDTTAEIDALSAGVLPLLVPGLRVGSDVRVSQEWRVASRSSVSSKKSSNRRSTQGVPSEMGGFSSEFSSPENHSTPAERKAQSTRTRKTSNHKRHHFSLPSLSLGKDGIHALTTWRNELNSELSNKLDVPQDATRRNSMQWEGSQSSQLNAVREEEESPRSASPVGAPLARSSSLRNPENLPSPSDVPQGVNSARNSLATLITALDQEFTALGHELHLPVRNSLPASAASDVTLFDLNATGPLAESTPHETARTHTRYSGQHEAVPPVPRLPSGTNSNRNSKRSSIVYIKSDENAIPNDAPSASTSKNTKKTTSWSDRVRPLMPKKSLKKSKAVSSENEGSSSPGGSGLRPLSLLQDRDVNSRASETKPLSLSKKQKGADENAGTESATPGKKGLKPLKLARNETTKQRAMLRKNEVLPNVVVRPPSEHHSGFAHAFYDML